MASNDYHFITDWRVEGTIEEISDILGDAVALKRWWPSVYLDVKQLKQGDKNGMGKEVDLYTKGWLPYTLRWQFTVTEAHYPHGFTLVARGDFVGRGIWTLTQNGRYAEVRYDWKIDAEKPLLKYFSFIMKPIFSANHRWAMAQGEQSLKLELARRHAETAQERAEIPAPPPSTFSNPLPLALGTLGIIGAGVILARLASRSEDD